MSWKWEEMTAAEFSRATREADYTCLLPFGVIEKHGEQLPLGTDSLVIEALAERVAALEPVVLFPRYYFGQIHEAKQCPGTIAIRHEVLFSLLENVCEEIARNGFRKVVILNGHGGNEGFLQCFNFFLLEKPRPYTVYTIRLSDYHTPVWLGTEWAARKETDFEAHGGEAETSEVLAIRPELVKMNAIRSEGKSLERLAHLGGVQTPTWWYANFPNHYAGDARPATEEKGEFLMERLAQRAAGLLRQVKQDSMAPKLEQEYFRRTNHGTTQD